MGNKEEDITDGLLTDDEKAAAKKQKEREKLKPKGEEPVKKVKSETVVSETPQDRFRRIMKDQGYATGVENITSVFFEGNTDDPSWLDETLKLSHVPAKNREILITTYFGKTPKELGIKIEPTSTSSSQSPKTDAEKKAADEKKSDEDLDLTELAKLGEDEIKSKMKLVKNKLVIAQMNDMLNEINKKSAPPATPQTPVQMRQVSRPVIGKDGNPVVNNGVMVYETVTEPINATQQGSGNDLISTLITLKTMGMMGDNKPQVQSAPSEVLKMMESMQRQMNDLIMANQIKSKDDDLKRVTEKMEKQAEEHRRELEKEKEEHRRERDKDKEERVRDLEQLEKRFTETIQHKKELDDIVGAISGNHKKEIDLLKKQVEHSQSSIEKTVVAKGTETVAKLTESMTGVAEDIVKPMAGVLKDHYSTVIDIERKKLGLPTLAKSLPEVSQDELEKFVQ